MNIDDLNKRYSTLKEDVKEQLEGAVKMRGGSVLFVSEEDPRLNEIDDLSELELPLIDAYSYNFGTTGSYYVTSLVIEAQGLAIYGVDENHCLDLEDEIQLDYLSIAGMLDILEKIPD